MNRTLAALKWFAATLATLGLLTSQAVAFVKPLRGGSHARLEGRPVVARVVHSPSHSHHSHRSPRSHRRPDGVRVVPYPLVRPFLLAVDGGLKKDQGALWQMRALASSASSGTLTTGQRTELNEVFQAQKVRIENVALATNFGDLGLLRGGDDVFLEGPPPGFLVFLDLPLATPGGFGLSYTNLKTVTNASATLNRLDSAVAQVAQYRNDLRNAWIQLQY